MVKSGINKKYYFCLQLGASSGLELPLGKDVTNGRQDQGVDEVEFMSSSPSSSSSDSP